MKAHRIVLAALLVALCLSAPGAGLAQADGSDFATGLNAYYKQQWAEAQDAFKRVVEKDPRDTMAWWYLIHTYYKRNDLHSVLYQVEQKVVVTESKDAMALAHMGLGYLARSMREAQMLDEAQKTFEKALELDKDLSVAHTGLGLVFYQRRMMPRAKAHFLSALRANPNDLMALERVGDIVMNDEKNPTQALSLFEQITQKAPGYPDGYWFMGSANYDMGQYEKCIGFMQKVMELDPNGVTQGYHAPMLMGKCYLKMKQYAQARDAFQLALKLNPNNPEARYYLEQSQNPQPDRGTPTPAPPKDGGKKKKK